MATGDLTSLDLVKTYMGLTGTDKDDLINQLIPQLSASIARYCDREFYLHDYRDFIYTEGGCILYLPQYPVTKVKRLVRALIEVVKVKTTRAGCKGASVQVINGEVLLQQWGDNEDSGSIDLATETTLAAVKAAIEALVGQAWQATIVSGYENHLSADLVEMPGQPALSPDYAELLIPDYDSTIYDHILDDSNGRVKSRSGFPDGRIFAEWQAGYGDTVDDMPADLVGLATAIVADAVRESASDKGMKSERLGDYQYTKFDTQVQADEFVVERYSEQLARFRRVSL